MMFNKDYIPSVSYQHSFSSKWVDLAYAVAFDHKQKVNNYHLKHPNLRTIIYIYAIKQKS